jgi:hypothetical protein
MMAGTEILIIRAFLVRKMRGIKIVCGLMLAVVAAGSCSRVDNGAIERNRRLWHESGIVNYRMTVDVQKTGHAMPMGKFIIEVRNREAVSIKLASDPTRDATAERFSLYDTIDDIFERIETAAVQRPDKMDVEYDAKLGYPKKLNLDPNTSAMDDELFFQVLEFEAL